MKRSLIIGSLASSLIFGGLSSCGSATTDECGGELSQRPRMVPDKASIGFAQEFGSGTFFEPRDGGRQRPVESLSILNCGLDNLEVTAVNFTGDSAFKTTVSYRGPDGGFVSTLPASVRGRQYFYVQVEFAPSQARAYSGVLNLDTNAQNQGDPTCTPVRDGGRAPETPCGTFNVSGCGVPTGRFLPDGGFVLLGDPLPDGGILLSTSPCYRDGGA